MTATGNIDLATRLRAEAALPHEWETAFAAVDRGTFVPHRAWFDDDAGVPRPIEYGTEEWTHAVYSDEPVVTQLDEGRVAWPGVSRMVTSSASQPNVVLRMLDALDVHPGHTALEIGTGTGYNAARLGDENVTTIEVDPVLTRQAREALHHAGHVAITVITKPGAADSSSPPGAPTTATAACSGSPPIATKPIPPSPKPPRGPHPPRSASTRTPPPRSAYTCPASSAASASTTHSTGRSCSTTSAPMPPRSATSPPKPSTQVPTPSGNTGRATSGRKQKPHGVGGSTPAGPTEPDSAPPSPPTGNGPGSTNPTTSSTP